MSRIRAADLRKSLGPVVRALEHDGEPVELTLRGQTVGVLISVRDWKERFASQAAREERRRLAAEILAERLPAAPVDETIKRLRER